MIIYIYPILIGSTLYWGWKGTFGSRLNIKYTGKSNIYWFNFSLNLSTYLECIGTDLVRDKFKFRKKDGTYTKNKGVVVEAQKICIRPMSQTLQSSYVTNFAFIKKNADKLNFNL